MDATGLGVETIGGSNDDVTGLEWKLQGRTRGGCTAGRVGGEEEEAGGLVEAKCGRGRRVWLMECVDT